VAIVPIPFLMPNQQQYACNSYVILSSVWLCALTVSCLIPDEFTVVVNTQRNYFFRFKTEDEAVAIANMTSSGLAGTDTGALHVAVTPNLLFTWSSCQSQISSSVINLGN